MPFSNKNSVFFYPKLYGCWGKDEREYRKPGGISGKLS